MNNNLSRVLTSGMFWWLLISFNALVGYILNYNPYIIRLCTGLCASFVFGQYLALFLVWAQYDYQSKK